MIISQYFWLNIPVVNIQLTHRSRLICAAASLFFVIKSKFFIWIAVYLTPELGRVFYRCSVEFFPVCPHTASTILSHLYNRLLQTDFCQTEQPLGQAPTNNENTFIWVWGEPNTYPSFFPPKPKGTYAH